MPKKGCSDCEPTEAAICWYVVLGSSDLSESQIADFYRWLHSSASHQAAFINACFYWRRGKVLEYLDYNSGRRKRIVCILLFVVLFLLSYFAFFSNVSTVELSSDRVVTGVGEQLKFEFGSGSWVELNTLSQLRKK